jgi:5-methylcytosine-specific restriction endonuclease McrA
VTVHRRPAKFCDDSCRAHWHLARKPIDPSRPIIRPIVRFRILERDGWRCYLCGTLIPKASRWPDPFAGTADHVVPRSKGGPDLDANLRAAHWQCNRKKGTKLVVELVT